MTQDTEPALRRAPTERLMVADAMVTAMATACGHGFEPVDEWETIWRNTVSTVTEASTPKVTPEQCEDILRYLRMHKTVLTPVPIDDLETPIDRWFSEAESVFFDCDLDGESAQESLPPGWAARRSRDRDRGRGLTAMGDST